MRRRRLALRQIEETRPDVSDLEDDEKEEERAPTFSLLVPAKSPAPPAAVAATRADPDGGDEEDGSSTQPMSPLAKTTNPKDNTDIIDDKPAIFQLYQEGFTPDQVLQLAYVRRRPPRARSMELEKQFVLPRPTLTLRDIVPPQRIPFQALFAVQPEKKRQREVSSNAAPLDTNKLGKARQSAVKYFANPMEASLAKKDSWKLLTQSDWHQVIDEAQALQAARSPSSNESSLDLWIPRISAVTDMLEDLKSDSYGELVWSKLLIPLVTQCVSANGGLAQASALFAALLRHSSLADLSPSAFRVQLRARDLRQVDAAFGAKAELQLLQLFHEMRRNPKASRDHHSNARIEVSVSLWKRRPSERRGKGPMQRQKKTPPPLTGAPMKPTLRLGATGVQRLQCAEPWIFLFEVCGLFVNMRGLAVAAQTSTITAVDRNEAKPCKTKSPMPLQSRSIMEAKDSRLAETFRLSAISKPKSTGNAAISQKKIQVPLCGSKIAQGKHVIAQAPKMTSTVNKLQLFTTGKKTVLVSPQKSDSQMKVGLGNAIMSAKLSSSKLGVGATKAQKISTSSVLNASVPKNLFGARMGSVTMKNNPSAKIYKIQEQVQNSRPSTSTTKKASSSINSQQTRILDNAISKTTDRSGENDTIVMPPKKRLAMQQLGTAEKPLPKKLKGMSDIHQGILAITPRSTKTKPRSTLPFDVSTPIKTHSNKERSTPNIIPFTPDAMMPFTLQSPSSLRQKKSVTIKATSKQAQPINSLAILRDDECDAILRTVLSVTEEEKEETEFANRVKNIQDFIEGVFAAQSAMKDRLLDMHKEGRIGIQDLHLSDEPTDEDKMLSVSLLGPGSPIPDEPENQLPEQANQLECE